MLIDRAGEIFASASEIAMKPRSGRLGGVPRATEGLAALVAAQGELEALVLVGRDPAYAGFGSKTLR